LLRANKAAAGCRSPNIASRGIAIDVAVTGRISSAFKEDSNPAGHCRGAICIAGDFWARASLRDAFEQRRKTRRNKEQSWLF